MSFWKNIFNSSKERNQTKESVELLVKKKESEKDKSVKLICEKCNEKYILGKDTKSITSEEAMALMPAIAGQLPKSLMVGHIAKDNPDKELLEEAKSTILRLGPERGWKCDKCHHTNSWKY